MILALRKQRQVDLCEASLVYTLNSRLARMRPCFKKKSKVESCVLMGLLYRDMGWGTSGHVPQV